MPLPLYLNLRAPSAPVHTAMHMGLWFERYFDGYAPDFSEVNKDRRSEWLREFKTAQLGDKEALNAKAEKMRRLATAQGGQARAIAPTMHSP